MCPPPHDMDLQMPPPPQDMDLQMPPPRQPPPNIDIQISEDFKMPSYTDYSKESYQKMNTSNNIPTDNFKQPHAIISENKQQVPIGVFGYSKHRNKHKNNTHLYGVS